ncbi:MAG: sulfatase [Planctomycetaceae bacterium]|nr:sulfatase [Planctomycetaceae bacterium]
MVFAAGSADRRPNIFFFFADDWGRYASTYSEFAPNTVFQTPAFDSVAKEGIKFQHAHVMSPSCTPCRSAILSGQYFYRTGRASILQPAVWDGDIPSYPLLLEEAGYFIGHTYKVWSPGTPADAPHGAFRTRYNRAGGRFNQFSQNVTEMIAAGKDREAAKEVLYQEGLGNFQQFLEARPEGQPFCYWFGPTNTHRKWVKGSGKKLWDLDPDDLEGKLPPFLPDVPEIREDFCDYLGETLALDAMLGRFLEKLREIGELENTVLVVSGDHGIPGFPRGKSHLYDFGTNVSLFIRVGANVKVDGYDAMKETFRDRTLDDFVNLMDLAPTFCELGGVTPPDCMNGRSLVPLLFSDQSGQVDPSRDYVVTGRERHVPNAREGLLPYPHRAIRTKEFLYIRNFCPERTPSGDAYHLLNGTMPTQNELEMDTAVTFPDMDCGPTKAWLVQNLLNPQWKQQMDWAFGLRPGEEFYDLSTDPFCLTNLADDEVYATKKKEHADRLMEILRSTNDPRVTGDNFYERPPFAGPVGDIRTTPEEDAKIIAEADRWVRRELPGWKAARGFTGDVKALWALELPYGMSPEFCGQKKVLMTSPAVDGKSPAVVFCEMKVPQEPNPKLHFRVSHQKPGGWILDVHIDGTSVYKQTIDETTLVSRRWLPIEIDLTPYAGKTIQLELQNHQIKPFTSTAYWAELPNLDCSTPTE